MFFNIMSLHLYNTLSRKEEEFKPIQEGRVKIYSCGPTVYNVPHVGNLRAFIFADTLYRWLKYGEKYQVDWVMNVTDVDDKTIKSSKEQYPEKDPKEALKIFTRHYEDAFFADLEKVGIKKDSFIKNPRATEYIKEMQDLVGEIYKQGYAKIIEGSVFFDVKKYAENKKYGQLLNLDLDSLKSGTRTLADETEKDNLQDFVLWKAKKEGEPSWDYQLDGQDLSGRPGWHIECSAMSCSLLGMPFDIHTGGVDLIFPHHENEIAQAEAGWNIKTANFWAHNEHLLVEGKKMSKSLGNFYVLADLINKGFSADAIRFFFVSNHYRAKVNLSDESLQSAENTLQKIRNQLALKKDGTESIANKKEEFKQAMQSDLNTSVAFAVLHEILKGDYKYSEVEEFFREAENIFGLRFFPENKKIPTEIEELAQKRWQAKKDKEFALADNLRAEISDKGYEIRDEGDSYEIMPIKK